MSAFLSDSDTAAQLLRLTRRQAFCAWLSGEKGGWEERSGEEEEGGGGWRVERDASSVEPRLCSCGHMHV